MSVASELLRLFEESRKSGSPDKILLSAGSKKLLEKALTEISQQKKIAMIVEGSTYFNDPPDSYRRDTRHTPQGMTHMHVFRNKNQMGVVNLDGSGHDGSSGKILYRRQGDFVRSKGFNLPKNNVIASDLNESYEPLYVVIISESELLELLWETEN
jgi:hypothetical protein